LRYAQAGPDTHVNKKKKLKWLELKKILALIFIFLTLNKTPWPYKKHYFHMIYTVFWKEVVNDKMESLIFNKINLEGSRIYHQVVKPLCVKKETFYKMIKRLIKLRWKNMNGVIKYNYCYHLLNCLMDDFYDNTYLF